MNLTPGEKLILVMLADIQEHLKVSGEINPAFIKSAIFDGQTWAIDWKYSGFSEGESSETVVKETTDILSMWRVIDNCVNRLSAADKEQLEKDCYPHGTKFEGFDGNQDPHIGVANFLIGKLGRFEERAKDPMNSHSSMSLPHYLGMLRRFESLEHRFDGLTPEQIRAIIVG